MATGSTQAYTTIQSPPSSTVFASAIYGSDGDTYGTSELFVGHSSTSGTAGRITWDGTEGAFDSGEHTVIFTLPAGGGSSHPVTWSVSDADTDPIAYSGQSYVAISTVKVLAGVQTNASVTIRSLTVDFYKNGVKLDSFSQSQGPSVDTRQATSPIAENILTITPMASDYDKAVATFSIELNADEGVYPSSNDLFVEIHVITSSGMPGSLPSPKPNPS